MEMTTTAMLGAAAIGLATACWSQLKAIGQRMLGLAIVHITVGGQAQNAVQVHCWNRLQQTKSSFRAFSGWHLWVKKDRKESLVIHEKIGDNVLLFWQGWKPLLVCMSKEGEKNEYGETSKTLTVTFLRGSIDPEQFLLDAAKTQGELMARNPNNCRFEITRFAGEGSMAARKGGGGSRSLHPGSDSSSSAGVYTERPIGITRAELGKEFESHAMLCRMALTPQMESAIAEVRRWHDAKQWYEERQIPWRRGWLLHGKPGTGKTSLVKAIAQSIDVPIYVFDLGSMDNAEFSNSWGYCIPHAPCIILFEDIDAVFKGRTNVLGETGGGLTFDCLLNCISGVDDTSGIFLVVTTNDLNSIDPALGIPDATSGMSSRPGRLDRLLELTSLDEDGRLKIAQRILSDCRALIPAIVAAGIGDTGAQFQERCTQTALRDFWDKKGAA